jgi:hypothetical protein
MAMPINGGSTLIHTTPPALGNYRHHVQQSAEQKEKQHAPELASVAASEHEVQRRECDQQRPDFAAEFLQALPGE